MYGNLRDYGTSILALLYVEVDELVWAILDKNVRKSYYIPEIHYYERNKLIGTYVMNE